MPTASWDELAAGTGPTLAAAILAALEEGERMSPKATVPR
jgi:hypothetical protein